VLLLDECILLLFIALRLSPETFGYLLVDDRGYFNALFRNSLVLNKITKSFSKVTNKIWKIISIYIYI
jgi:hypothetical protein